MTNTEDQDTRDQISLGDLFRPLVRHRLRILMATIMATVFTALIGGLYFIRQPTARSAFLEFRPVFQGADLGKYPNGLPFSSTDIVNASIVDQVVAKNHLEAYCPLEVFHSGLAVLESSPALEFLNLEFQARLGDTKLTAVDRQRIQDEYSNRRASMQSRFQLRYVEPEKCSPVPDPILSKVLTEILETWASDAQTKRGVMKFRMSVLTSAIFDQQDADTRNLLIRADLLRTGVARVIANIHEVELLPGSELVRGSDKDVSFAEVRAELEDLIQARLEPLIAQAGRGLGRQALQWIEQALRAATIQLDAAKHRADSYSVALREYSGITTTPATPTGSGGQRQQSSSDVQTLAPQIDRTFIDRIVELSATNTAFRQEITRKSIEASVEAVNRAAVVAQYTDLLSSMKQGGIDDLTTAAVSQTLTQVTTQAKDATRRFNEIFDEFSRVGLRSGPTMYRVEQPTESTVIRAFGLRSLAILVIAVGFATPIVYAFFLLARYHFRKFVSNSR